MSQFLLDHVQLVAVFVASGLWLAWMEVGRLMSGAQNEISTLQTTQLINQRNAVIVDVRDATEFGTGHIPNSRHIPLEELEQRLPELAKLKARPVVLSCKTGALSGKAQRLLRKHEFTDVYVLKGGLTAWSEANLPLQKSAAAR